MYKYSWPEYTALPAPWVIMNISDFGSQLLQRQQKLVGIGSGCSRHIFNSPTANEQVLGDDRFQFLALLIFSCHFRTRQFSTWLTAFSLHLLLWGLCLSPRLLTKVFSSLSGNLVLRDSGPEFASKISGSSYILLWCLTIRWTLLWEESFTCCEQCVLARSTLAFLLEAPVLTKSKISFSAACLSVFPWFCPASMVARKAVRYWLSTSKPQLSSG